jgi:glycerophosphoryl diester phosphodiesterase
VRIVGHRGARDEAPENTIGGFHYALERGIRHFELDLRLSADGVPMVIHDATTARTCSVSLRVDQCTAAQLEGLDAAATQPTWTDFEPIPTLASLLPLLLQCDSVQLEIKSDRPARLSKLIKALRPLLANHHKPQFTLTSFDKKALALARSLVPAFRRGLVCERRFADNIGHALRLDCALLVYHYRLLSAERIEKSKKAGLEVSTYTVNDSNRILRLREWGIDSIITDRPAYYLHLQRKHNR